MINTSITNYWQVKLHKDWLHLMCEHKNSLLLHSSTAQLNSRNIFLVPIALFIIVIYLYASHYSWSHGIAKCQLVARFEISANAVYNLPAISWILCILTFKSFAYYIVETYTCKCGDGDALGMLSHEVMTLCWSLTYWLCQLDQGYIMSTSSREQKVLGHVNKSSLLQNSAPTGLRCKAEGYCVILKGFILW